METITAADYILYSFLAFIALLQVAIVVTLWRQGRDIGELKGEIKGVHFRIDALSERVGRLEDRVGRLEDRVGRLEDRVGRLEDRVGRLEETVASLSREVGELKGLILALHQRVDLVMRHRHDTDNGQVVLTPEEVAAD